MILAGTIYSIIRAIIQFVFSNGDGEKIKKARNGIRYTIIGMVITVLLLFFFPILFAKIGSQNSQAYSASAILDRAMFLGRKILNT
jgi:Na+/proline symporter